MTVSKPPFQILDITSKSTVLNPATGFIDAYDYTINPYIGCQFGCQYCYAINFVSDPDRQASWGEWAAPKLHAPDAIRELLYGSRNARHDLLDEKTIYVSTSTDPYQPTEKRHRITRRILEVLAGVHTPAALIPIPPPRPRVVIQTRSPLVVRDIDLFSAIWDNDGRIQVNMTVTTDSEQIRRDFEPHTMTNHGRLAAVRRISQAGIPTAVTLTPWLGAADPTAFIQAVTSSGASRFTIQPFHSPTAGPFVAKTAAAAVATRDRLYGGSESAYQAAYREFKHALVAEIQRLGLVFAGEGKPGFRPPWD